MRPIRLTIILLITLSVLFGCKSSAVLPLNDNTIVAVDRQELLTDIEAQVWFHSDPELDSIPGVSTSRLHNALQSYPPPQTVIVAIIDSGVDLDHEDLSHAIWTNAGEIPDNGLDDDDNGYADDVHGWNFLGEAYHEQLEFTRILANGLESHPEYDRAQRELKSKRLKYRSLLMGTSRWLKQLQESHAAVKAYLNTNRYSIMDLDTLSVSDPQINAHVQTIKVMGHNGYDDPDALIALLEEDSARLSEYLDYHLNLDFNGRSVVGDDPDDFNDRDYGNGNVFPNNVDETHGTHVAGIVAANRQNGIGTQGVASNVKLMVLRTVPNGDEYDKDVALAIRYAADNGAKVINMSFGKEYSRHFDWVHEAIRYAEQKDVLIVAGSGNEHFDLSKTSYFPNDIDANGNEFVDNYIVVGASNQSYEGGLLANYSNYSHTEVDVIAPGTDIYATLPGNQYGFQDGTSMAAPIVTGTAALLRGYFPELRASDVKRILLDSGLKLDIQSPNYGFGPSWSQASKSGRLFNAYRAFRMAEFKTSKRSGT